jgi:hypothetical protein
METMYVLHPGCVRSQHDGQYHHIGASRLAELYRIPPGRWVVYDADLHDPSRKPSDWVLVHLFPRDSGRYELPEPAPA